jgi:hypothetical protein
VIHEDDNSGQLGDQWWAQMREFLADPAPEETPLDHLTYNDMLGLIDSEAVAEAADLDYKQSSPIETAGRSDRALIDHFCPQRVRSGGGDGSWLTRPSRKLPARRAALMTSTAAAAGAHPA